MCSFFFVKIATRQQYLIYIFSFSKNCTHAYSFLGFFFLGNPTHVLTTLSKTGIILNFLGPDSFKHHDAQRSTLVFIIYGLFVFNLVVKQIACVWLVGGLLLPSNSNENQMDLVLRSYSIQIFLELMYRFPMDLVLVSYISLVSGDWQDLILTRLASKHAPVAFMFQNV